jgi:cytochrome b pre-mRNA-processing protein 3
MRSIMAMLRRPGQDSGPLYAALVAEARRPDWYRQGGAEDSLDGRFAVLASLVALAILRLEAGGEDAARAGVSLTEAFIADMDAQMREAGFGDPSLGKQVRHMVGALASRVERWRAVTDNATPAEWAEAVRFSLHREATVDESAATFAAESLRRFHEGLGGKSDDDIVAGRIG